MIERARGLLQKTPFLIYQLLGSQLLVDLSVHHFSQVTPYVDETVAIEFDYANKESSSPPKLTQWLADRNLSCDDRKMRLKEGYVKEGSTMSVMGVVRRVNNVLMIVPPSEPVAAKCQWTKCLFPPSLDGIVLRCEDTSDLDVIIV